MHIQDLSLCFLDSSPLIRPKSSVSRTLILGSNLDFLRRKFGWIQESENCIIGFGPKLVETISSWRSNRRLIPSSSFSVLRH
ncbi:hypothetical protein Syun_009403 [Stephania yunnanensis]|uniref:Uncharacterized protein n=1 Tax=Stephania yunnanensis TaxID=152371 RepID=A0AAP0KGK4_9MAGN